METTHKPIIDYFEGLNKALKDFPDNSFFRMDLEEIMGAFRSGINFPAMAVESPDGDGENSGESNSVIGRMFAFTIYQDPQKGNFAQQNEMIDECERIGLKILARMRLDATNPDSPIYNRFKVNTAKWTKIGPLFTDELYGYRFTGMLTGSEPLKVNPDDWNDIDSTC